MNYANPVDHWLEETEQWGEIVKSRAKGYFQRVVVENEVKMTHLYFGSPLTSHQLQIETALWPPNVILRVLFDAYPHSEEFIGTTEGSGQYSLTGSSGTVHPWAKNIYQVYFE